MTGGDVRPAEPDLSSLLMRQQIVDLTLTLGENLPATWPTHMPFQHKTWNYFVDRPDEIAPLYCRFGPYQARWVLMDEHIGTHCDAPNHFIPAPDSGLQNAGEAGEVSVDLLDLSQLIGPAAVIAVTMPEDGAAGRSPVIGADAIGAWETLHGEIRAGEVVLFNTGWDRHYQPGGAGLNYCYHPVITGKTPGWPAPDAAAMELLISRGVRCVGIDAPSMGAVEDGGPVHLVGLSAGAVFVEMLTRLAELPPRGAQFVFLPLKLRGGTGSPGRAIALLPGAA